MTTIPRVSNSTLDSGDCSQRDGVLQGPNSAPSLGEIRPHVTGNHLESRNSAPEVHIQVDSWNSSLGMSKSERRPAYLLTPQTSRPPVNGDGGPSSSGRKFRRFSSQSYTEVFGTRLQTEPKDQNRAASNQASYDKFRTRSAGFDRQSSTVRGNSGQGQEGIAETSHSDAEEDEDGDPLVIRPSRYFGPELDELRVRFAA